MDVVSMSGSEIFKHKLFTSIGVLIGHINEIFMNMEQINAPMINAKIKAQYDKFTHLYSISKTHNDQTKMLKMHTMRFLEFFESQREVITAGFILQKEGTIFINDGWLSDKGIDSHVGIWYDKERMHGIDLTYLYRLSSHIRINAEKKESSLPETQQGKNPNLICSDTLIINLYNVLKHAMLFTNEIDDSNEKPENRLRKYTKEEVKTITDIISSIVNDINNDTNIPRFLRGDFLGKAVSLIKFASSNLGAEIDESVFDVINEYDTGHMSRSVVAIYKDTELINHIVDQFKAFKDCKTVGDVKQKINIIFTDDYLLDKVSKTISEFFGVNLTPEQISGPAKNINEIIDKNVLNNYNDKQLSSIKDEFKTRLEVAKVEATKAGVGQILTELKIDGQKFLQPSGVGVQTETTSTSALSSSSSSSSSSITTLDITNPSSASAALAICDGDVCSPDDTDDF